MNIKNLVKVADSQQAKVADDKFRANLKRNFRARVMDTESTEDAVDAAVDVLKDEDPATAVTVAVEVLGEVIEDLQQKADSVPQPKGRCSADHLKELKDSLRNKIKDTESTEDVVAAATDLLKDEAPEDAIQVTTEILGEVIDKLQEGDGE